MAEFWFSPSTTARRSRRLPVSCSPWPASSASPRRSGSARAQGPRERLAEFGAAKVYVADGGDIADYVVAPAAEVLAGLVAQKSPAAVLLAATGEGKEIAGRLAVKIDSGVLTDAVGLTPGDGGLVAEQSIFGGAINVESTVRTGTPIVAVRPNSVTAEPAPAAAEIEPAGVD